MLANFFGKSNPANFIIIFLVFLVYATGAFFVDATPKTGLLFLGSMFFGFLVLFFFFNFILSKNKLTLFNSYGFLFYVLLLGSFPQILFDRNELISNIILLIMLRRVYSLRTPKEVVKKVFDSGFWLGILFILNPFMLVFAGLIYSSISLFQKLSLRSFLIPVLGFSVPLICYFTYCYWYGMETEFYQLFYLYTDYDYHIYFENRLMIPMIVVGTFTILSIIFKTPSVLQVSGNYRKFWTLLILNLLIALIYVGLTKDKTGAELLCALFPTAIVLTNGIEGFSKPFYQDLVLGLFAIMPIVLFIF